MNEFEIIRTCFAPLAKDFPGSLNLGDDAALVDVAEGQQLVITKDAIVEGVHFIGNESPALIARKLLRTNLSDLAAKGATPYCYFLSLAIPKNTDKNWFSSFASGLAEDQKEFGIHLAGGDTTASKGGVFLSLTALGIVPYGGMVKRSGARIGDGIFVSGTLGDAALGLSCLRAQKSREEFLIGRYLLPEPRLSLGIRLRGIATSSMDISDGLVQDLGHICNVSGVGAVIHTQKIPLSNAARRQQQALEAALSGGDDYELLFTAPADAALPEGVTRIGEIVAGNAVMVLDETGQAMDLKKKGFSHF